MSIFLDKRIRCRFIRRKENALTWNVTLRVLNGLSTNGKICDGGNVHDVLRFKKKTTETEQSTAERRN